MMGGKRFAGGCHAKSGWDGLNGSALVSVAALTYYATLHHRRPIRFAMSATATRLSMAIVVPREHILSDAIEPDLL